MPSNVELYAYYCRRSSCVPNSAVTRYLGEAANRPLTVLDVSMNYLGPRGLIPLLDLVKNAKTISTLDVSNNAMQQEQVEHLAYCLALHPCMRIVRLCNNQLHDGHLDVLLQLLAHNATIEFLSVEGNAFSAAALQALVSALKKSEEARAQQRKEEEEHIVYLKSRQPRTRLSFQARLNGEHISKEESGGYVHYATWWKTPQYIVKISRSSRVSFLLACTRADVANQVGLLLMRHDGVHRVVEIVSDTIVAESAIEGEECTLEAHLDADESYVVMPFSFNPGRAVDFDLVATLRNAHTAQAEGWITLEKVDARYDWCTWTVDTAWTSENAGGSTTCPSWRRNDMYHIVSTDIAATPPSPPRSPIDTATVYVLLMKEADPYENDERAIGVDVVGHDAHNTEAPPLFCKGNVVRATYPHEQKTFISLKLSVPVEELDFYVVPSTAVAGQIGAYSITIFSSIPVHFTRSAFPHGWRYRAVTGQWDADCCGGCRQLCPSWKSNPAIEVCLEDAVRTIVACVAVLPAEPAPQLACSDAEGGEEGDEGKAKAEESPERAQRKAELEEFRHRHSSTAGEVCVAVLSSSPPLYPELATSPLCDTVAMTEASNIPETVYVVPMLRNAAETAGYVVELFSPSSFVVCGATQPLAVRERQAQLAVYSAENGRRAAERDAEKQANRGGADLPTLREERRVILDNFSATKAPHIDRDFPRGTSSLFLDPSSAPPLDFPNATEWRRASELGVDRGDREGDAVTMSPPSPYGPRHWFASVLNAAAAKPGWLSRIFVEYFAEAGFAQFAFYKQDRWIGVTVDDYLLVDSQSSLVYGHSADNAIGESAVFLPLAEKAYAKLHRCYEAMEPKVCAQQSLLELLQQGLMDVSGGHCCAMRIRPADGSELPRDERDALWRRLKTGVSHCVLCCLMLEGGSVGARERSRVGLLPDRLYGIVDARFIEQQRLVKVRNFASHEDADTKWRGRWAAGSPLWTDTLLEVLQFNPEEEAMWMHFDEALYYFTHLVVTEVFPHKTTAAGDFLESTANDPGDADISLRNPQYALLVTPAATAADAAPIEVHIGLHRHDPRLDITRVKHATADMKTAVGFAVLATEDNLRRVCRVADQQLVQLITPNMQRDVYCSLQLTPESLRTQHITLMPFREHMRDPNVAYSLSASCSDAATVAILHVAANTITAVTGLWDGKTGTPTSPLWRDNPQFFLSPSEAMEVTVTLRVAHPTSTIHGFTIHNTQRCNSFLTYESATVIASGVANEIGAVPSCVVRLAGMAERRGMPYVVVPYTSGEAEDFTLEVTANRPVQLRRIEPRLDWHRVHKNISINSEIGNTGGSMAFPSWRFNTQLTFVFPVEREGRLFISARRIRSADTRVRIGLALLRSGPVVKGGYRRLLAYAEDDIVAQATEKAGAEALIDTQLSLPSTGGALILVVFTDQPYKEAEVELSVYAAATVEVAPVVEWAKVRWEEGAWALGTTAGGSRRNFASWINNPFYGLSVVRPTKVVLLLLQYPCDREHPKVKRYGQRKAFLPPPVEFKERCTAIELSVVKYDKDLTEVASINAGTAAEAILTADLEPGEAYLLVPCTTEPQHDGEFKLFVFADNPIDLFEAEKSKLYYV